MRKIVSALSVVTLTIAAPYAANAQGAPRGAVEGAERGAEVGGAPGAAVGGAVGAVVGGVAGLLGADQRPRFHAYVIHHRHPSYHYGHPVTVGVELPEEVTYYDVPPEFGVRGYRYTIVDDHTVLVDPGRRVVVQVID